MTATLSTRTAVTTCAVPGRPHEAADGIQLCRNHFDELSEWLYDVEREHAQLSIRPSLAGNWDGARGGKLASHTTPARINPLVHRDPRHVPLDDLIGMAGADDTLSVLGTLRSWSSFIRSERDLTPPGTWVTERIPGRIGPYHDECTHMSCRLMRTRYFALHPQTVTTERVFLSRHLEWAASQPWIGKFFYTIRKLRGQLQAVNGTGDPRVGLCPKCGGRLAIIKPKHTSGTPLPEDAYWAAECDRDALHHWKGNELIKLRLELEERKAK